jgi:hypothetical protein
MDESQTVRLRRDYPLCFNRSGDGMQLPVKHARVESAFGIRWAAAVGNALEITDPLTPIRRPNSF